MVILSVRPRVGRFHLFILEQQISTVSLYLFIFAVFSASGQNIAKKVTKPVVNAGPVIKEELTIKEW
jgi:hypothetical protein